MNAYLESLLDGPLDDSIRGVPPDAGPLRLRDAGAAGWRPAAGDMPLPVLTLDEEAYAANRDRMIAYARHQGVALAPHAKTPMAPQLARALVDAGAWGATVANVQQASVLLRAGVTRLILANQVGGLAAGRHLGALLAAHPAAEMTCFADSPAAVAALAVAAERAGRAGLPVLVEVGAGRGGARDRAAAEAVIRAVHETRGRLVLGGVATYEGAAAGPDAAATATAIAALMDLTAEAFALVRAAEPRRHLILTAGGSSFFDLVVEALAPVARGDRNTTLVLRSGAVFFHDHGVYERALGALGDRGGWPAGCGAEGGGFRPALRLWAEVLSRPEAGLAICGFGMRDASFDQGLPRPLRVHRGGAEPAGVDAADLRVSRLNDQHAFLVVPEASPLAVGDVVEFGISHPCTCLDRWRVVFGLGTDGRVVAAYRTVFG